MDESQEINRTAENQQRDDAESRTVSATPNPSNTSSTSPPAPVNTVQHHVHITVRQQQATNNNNGEFPQQTQNLFHMRDRLFLALFFRVSLIYARAFPKTLRRVLEFCLLMQSIILLFILTYIHVVYNQTPITCLADYKNSWPKDGILRVEVTTEPASDYDIQKSYAKEERLRQRASSENGHDDLLTMMLTADTLLLDKMMTTAGELLQSVTSKKDSEAERPTENKADSTEPNLKPSETTSAFIEEVSSETEGKEALSPLGSLEDISALRNSSDNIDKGDDANIISPSFLNRNDESSSGQDSSMLKNEYDYDFEASGDDSVYFNKTIEEIELIKMNKMLEKERFLKSSLSDFEMFTNSVWLQDQAYIVEYALEYGFLRLSPDTRHRLNIPVKIVTLDPSRDVCFGDNLSRFLLDNFLGYDDILMSSIKNLAEAEENKGYLRNVVTGEQFRFVPMWMARSAYIPALLIMLVFTVSISMLLRYSHHQIFVFIVDLLNNIEGVGAIHIPAAPLFTVILALVGMEAIMSEFFNDTSTAFYVILIVWIADQYDSVCSHTPMTRTYWVRFFYLYHFCFYAYHYRFNGQHGGLALLVSWSFIQHSMVYFYHHYELPTILRQAQPDDPTNNASHPHVSTAASSAPASSSAATQTTATTTAANTSSGSDPQPGSSYRQTAPAPPSQPQMDETSVSGSANRASASISNFSNPISHHPLTSGIPSPVNLSHESNHEPTDNTSSPATFASRISSALLQLNGNTSFQPVGLNNLNDLTSTSSSTSIGNGLRLRTAIQPQLGEGTARVNLTPHPLQQEQENDDELD